LLGVGLLGVGLLGVGLLGVGLLGVGLLGIGLLGDGVAGARPIVRPGGGAITSGSGAAENMRATASSPVMLLRTRFGKRPIVLGAPRSRESPEACALPALHAPGRAPRRPRISESASAPPTFGLGGSALRAASRAPLLAPTSGGSADIETSRAASSVARSAREGLADVEDEEGGEDGGSADAADDACRSAADAGDVSFRSTEAASARRAAGVDSSTTARRRAGAPDGAELVEGVTVTDWDRTLRPRTVLVRAIGADGGLDEADGEAWGCGVAADGPDGTDGADGAGGVGGTA